MNQPKLPRDVADALRELADAHRQHRVTVDGLDPVVATHALIRLSFAEKRVRELAEALFPERPARARGGAR